MQRIIASQRHIYSSLYIKKFLKRKITSVVFMRTSFMLVASEEIFFINEMFNFLQATPKKKDGVTKLFRLVNSANKFIGSNKDFYSLAMVEGKKIRGKIC